jgi:oligopeptide transport system substrate-binding protein
MRLHLVRLIGGLSGTLFLCSLAIAQVTFNRGIDADPETLDPHKTSSVVESTILRDLLEGLVIYNARAEVVPGAADSWTVSDDGRTYQFRLRDAKWSNGDPLKASDFAYSYRRIMSPATGAKYANILFPILNSERINKGQLPTEDLGVKSIDDRTLEITLERPTPYFLELLTHQTSLPVHPASVEKHGPAFVKPGNYVSNGAYVLSDFVPNSHIRLVKNSRFHDAKNVSIEIVNYMPAPDLAAAVRRYQAGELDFLSDLPGNQIKLLKQRFGAQVVLGPYLGIWVLIVNTSKAPFDDVRVRRALSLAIDRDFIAEQIWGETMLPAYSFVPPGINNYGPPASLPEKGLSIIEREDQAKSLLSAAGYGAGGKPLKVEIRYNASENNRNSAVAIADMWKRVGVETTFVSTDLKTHFAFLREGGDFDIARYGWIGDYSDPQNFLFLVQSDNKGFNAGRYHNREYDSLMNEASTETDVRRRIDLLKRAEEIFVRDLPWIPVLHFGTKNLVSPRLKGFSQNLRGVAPTRFLAIQQ